MKRKYPSSSSSSSSSSCTESPIPENEEKKPTSKLEANKNPTTSAKSRSSIYRGVTRHRWTGRYEAHLWDKSTWNTVQNKRGRQIYLGAYDNEEDAARTYDLAALKYWGPATVLNFPLESYTKELEEMQKLSKEEYLASLRRRSSGFSRGVSKYRGVARHHHNGRWEARIGRVCGNKYLYLGTYSTQEEAAVAYDMAAIEFRGPNAVTNFDISNYVNKVADAGQDEAQPKPEINVIDEAQDKPKPSSPKLETMGGLEGISDQQPWDLCLDIGFRIPDVPLEKGSEDLDYNYKGFEDNIECIFEDGFDLLSGGV